MKFIVVLFWSLILSELAGFVIAKLNDTAFMPSLSAIIAVFFVLIVFVIDKVGILPDPEAK
jgi:ABC-type glucose/galactose transport system permease subunit